MDSCSQLPEGNTPQGVSSHRLYSLGVGCPEHDDRNQGPNNKQTG